MCLNEKEPNIKGNVSSWGILRDGKTCKPFANRQKLPITMDFPPQCLLGNMKSSIKLVEITILFGKEGRGSNIKTVLILSGLFFLYHTTGTSLTSQGLILAFSQALIITIFFVKSLQS